MFIRQATLADIPSIISLYTQLHPADRAISLDKAESSFEQAAKSGVIYLVAEEDNKIVGSLYIAIIPNITKLCSPIGFIENVVVAEDYRCRGIGKELINTAVQTAKDSGCYKVILSSNVKRTEAHQFYESIGFDGNSKRTFEIRF
jgi:N-acetylglutamate synthase and related acetyltransferases